MSEKLTPTLEDYLGAILRFQRQKGFARVKDISECLRVAKSAVTAALRSLAAKGLINYAPYEPVTLAAKGRRQADQLLLRHRIIRDFVENVLAIESERAERIACEMEHAIDGRALERFVCFLAFISTRPSKGRTWQEEFERFIEKGAGGRTCRQCIEAYVKKTREGS